MKVHDAFIALGTLLYVGVTQIDSADLRREAQSDERLVICTLYEIQGMSAFPHRSEISHIHCVTDAGETFRVTNISDDLSDGLRSGQTQISVPRSRISSSIIDMAAVEGEIVQYQNLRYKKVDREGTFRLAVIRVRDINGLSPDKNSSQISDDIFGTNGDSLNLVSFFDVLLFLFHNASLPFCTKKTLHSSFCYRSQVMMNAQEVKSNGSQELVPT